MNTTEALDIALDCISKVKAITTDKEEKEKLHQVYDAIHRLWMKEDDNN